MEVIYAVGELVVLKSGVVGTITERHVNGTYAILGITGIVTQSQIEGLAPTSSGNTGFKEVITGDFAIPVETPTDITVDHSKLILAVGDTVKIVSEKKIARHIRGKYVNIVSIGDKCEVAINGSTYNCAHSDIQYLVVAPRDTVLLASGDTVIVDNIFTHSVIYTTKGTQCMADITDVIQIVKRYVHIIFNNLVRPIREGYTMLTRKVLTSNNGKLTFYGFPAVYEESDFEVTSEAPPVGIKEYMDLERVHILVDGTIEFRVYLKEKYMIDFLELSSVLNSVEPISLTCTSGYPRIVSIKAGRAITKTNRTKSVIKALNKIITS